MSPLGTFYVLFVVINLMTPKDNSVLHEKICKEAHSLDLWLSTDLLFQNPFILAIDDEKKTLK